MAPLELARTLRELEESRDSAWSAQCLAQLVAIARDLGEDQDLHSLLRLKSSFGPAGVKLLIEVKRVLLAVAAAGAAGDDAKRQVLRCFGQLLFWSFELQLLAKSSSSRVMVVDDSAFEAQLNLLLDAVQSSSAHNVDAFFAKALVVAAGFHSEPVRRLAESVENSLERYASRMSSSTSAFDAFCRAVCLRAPRLSVPCLVRCCVNRLFAHQPSSSSHEPVLLRLLAFLLGTLDFTSSLMGDNVVVEQEVALECVRGDYNLVRLVSEALLVSSQAAAAATGLSQTEGGGEDEGAAGMLLVQLVCRVYACVAGSWHVLLERTSTAVALTLAGAMELVLTRLTRLNRTADAPVVASLTSAVSVLLQLASSSSTAAATTTTTLQSLQQQHEEETALQKCTLRVNLALCFHSDAPQAQLFGLSLTSSSSKTPIMKEQVDILLLALGFESTATASSSSSLDVHLEQLVFHRLGAALDDTDAVEAMLWAAGEFALRMHNNGVLEQRQSWRFSFDLAHRRIKLVRRQQHQQGGLSPAQDRLALLFQAFSGLGEVRSSIRHLQDLAWYFIAFGKRDGFSIAADRFLEDVAKTLFDMHRYWECGNVYVMLGTCGLACKRYTASSHHLVLAAQAFAKLSLASEVRKVKQAARVFAKHAPFPREWDWCLDSEIEAAAGLRSSSSSFAHYFLVGAVGVGDADLTVVRVVLASAAQGRAQEVAFDEAVRYLESGSFRRRIAGQLRWAKTGDAVVVQPRFFPSEMVGQDEFGFWIQRVWPVVGEEHAVEHCSGRWGLVGQPDLVVSVKDRRRSLNALISACSVVVGAADAACELDIPLDWDSGRTGEETYGDDDEDEENIPLPLNPPPPPTASNNHNSSFFPTNDSPVVGGGGMGGSAARVSFLPDDSLVQMEDAYPFEDDEEDEDGSGILPPSSPPPPASSLNSLSGSDLDIAPPSSPPPYDHHPQPPPPSSYSSYSASPITPPVSDAEQRKREFKRRREEERLQQEEEERQRHERQQRKDEKRRRKQLEAEQQQEAAARARTEAKQRQMLEEAAAANALAREQDRILLEQEQAARRSAEEKLARQQQREHEEQLALKQHLEAQYRRDQQQQQQQDDDDDEEEEEAARMQREVDEEHARLQEQKRILKLRQLQQQQQQQQTSRLQSQDDDDDNSPPAPSFLLNTSSVSTSSTGSGKNMLIMKRRQPATPPSPPTQQPQPQPSSSSGSFSSRRIVMQPVDAAPAPAAAVSSSRNSTSPPKPVFNVNGAKITLQEWEQLERYKEKGEGWLAATVLSQGAVSLRFTPGLVEVYLEPSFVLLRTVRLRTNAATVAAATSQLVVEKPGTNVIELKDLATTNNSNPLLLVCGQVEMLRALLSTFA